MYNTSKPALVTGGCGFVGRHLARRLLAEGYDLWLVDDCSTGIHPDEWLPGALERREVAPGVVEYTGDHHVVFLHGDARDFFAGRIDLGSLAEPAFGDVFHFAAVVGGRATIDGNPMAVAIDLALDALCFNWAVRTKPDRLLYASSSAAYPVDLQGEDGAVALKESDIQFGGRLGQPDMTYGWSKLTGEYLGRIAHEHYGLHVASVRPFSGYGEEQDLTYPVPSIALRAARRRPDHRVGDRSPGPRLRAHRRLRRGDAAHPRSSLRRQRREHRQRHPDELPRGGRPVRAAGRLRSRGLRGGGQARRRALALRRHRADDLSAGLATGDLDRGGLHPSPQGRPHPTRRRRDRLTEAQELADMSNILPARRSTTEVDR